MLIHHYAGCKPTAHLASISTTSFSLPLSSKIKMYSEGPIPSPEDVDYYEECVVADEVYLPSSPGSGEDCPSSVATDATSRRDADRIPKSNSGRISKKSKQGFLCYTGSFLC